MNPLFGTYAGIIVSADDPEHRGRAQLRIPQVMGMAVSGWAEPVSIGAARPGDQVYVVFEGGDQNFPLFWPRIRIGTQGWTPLSLESGWAPPTGSDGPPVWRPTTDGMIEFHGVAQTASTPATGTNVKFASLPENVRPLYTSYQMCASDNRGAYGARQAMAINNTQVTTTSTTYVDLSGPTLSFTAPGSGEVLVVIDGWLRSSTAGDTAYMSARITQGSTVIMDADDDRACIVTGTSYAAVSSTFLVSGLKPGFTHSAAVRCRSATSTGSSATFDTRRVAISPTWPFTSPHVRVGVTTSGDLTVLYPNGSAGTNISLAGFRARLI